MPLLTSLCLNHGPGRGFICSSCNDHKEIDDICAAARHRRIGFYGGLQNPLYMAWMCAARDFQCMRRGIQEGIARYSLRHVKPASVDRYIAFVEALSEAGLFPEHCIPSHTISMVDLQSVDLAAPPPPLPGALHDMIDQIRLDADPFDGSIPVCDQVSQSEARTSACLRFARLGGVTGDVVLRALSALHDATVTETRWLAVVSARYFLSTRRVPADAIVQFARAFAKDSQLVVRNELLELLCMQPSEEPADLFSAARQLVRDADDNLALAGVRSLLAFDPCGLDGASPPSPAKDSVLIAAGKLLIEANARIVSIMTRISGNGFWPASDERLAPLVPNTEPAADENSVLILKRHVGRSLRHLRSAGAAIFASADPQ